jgi:hypothetical protein
MSGAGVFERRQRELHAGRERRYGVGKTLERDPATTTAMVAG